MDGRPLKSDRTSLIALLTMLAVAVWAMALLAALQIHHYPQAGEWIGFDICGPWGCAARPEALVGYHSFWLVLLAPPAFWAGIRASPSVASRAAWALVGVGAGLTLSIAGGAVYDCLANGPENLRQYWLQIAGFTLASSTDVPAVQIAVAGLAFAAGGRVKQLVTRRGRPPRTLPDRGGRFHAAAEGSPETP